MTREYKDNILINHLTKNNNKVSYNWRVSWWRWEF